MLSLSKFVSNGKKLSSEFSDFMSTKFKNLVRESVSKCKLCQVENERFSRDCLSTKLKTKSANTFQVAVSVKLKMNILTEIVSQR